LQLWPLRGLQANSQDGIVICRR